VHVSTGVVPIYKGCVGRFDDVGLDGPRPRHNILKSELWPDRCFEKAGAG
jgi:hypothetical protein